MKYDDLNHLISTISENPAIASKAMRAALSSALWAEYTGYTSIKQLSKTEKTVIGTRIERAIKKEFNMGDSQSILDIEFKNGTYADIKTTCRNNWMIPPECVGHNCILIKYDDNSYSMGAFKAKSEFLTEGTNQDRKRTIKASEKRNIVWFINDASI